MFYAIDYSPTSLTIKGSTSQETLGTDAVPEGSQRVIIDSAAGLAALEPQLLLRIANYKTTGAAFTEPPAAEDIWALLEGGAKAETAEKPKAEKPKATKKADSKPKKNLAKKASKGLTSSATPPKSGSTEGNVPPETQEKPMAAKAKKANGKAKAKAKAAKPRKTGGGGAPREGTKAAKLLALITRPQGATFAEMKAATGWKEMRGTALVLAGRVGKTLESVKDPEGKKATRWVAK